MEKIMVVLGKSFQTTYKDAAEALIAEIAHRKKLSAKQSAQLRAELFQTINDAHKRSISEAKREMKEVLKEINKGASKRSA